MTRPDRSYMQMALGLGARGLGQVWPRPSVGCVLVLDGRIVGRGRTTEASHGERAALTQAGPLARGATAYVTLEPCAHHGRTPPCADALVDAGVARVVSALEDPDPRVCGQGHAKLRDAGVQVEVGLMAAEAERTHQGFLSRVRTGRPMVTLKLANSFDGRIATASGESRWITGPDARRWVHRMRATHDAVLVGAGTARADDPMLTVRGLGAVRQPVRIVVSRRLDLPLDGALAKSAGEVPLWLCCGTQTDPDLRQRWAALGARIIEVPVARGGQIDPLPALRALGEAGLTRVFCEGGGGLAASLLATGCVDTLVGFTAGLALGAEGWPALGALGVDRLAEAPRFALDRAEAIGGDVMHIWRRTNEDTHDLG